MRILFDHGTPAGIARALASHSVTEAIERGWDQISNGDLLKLAEANGFELLLTTDKRIRYQQNLTGRRIAIVVLGTPNGGSCACISTESHRRWMPQVQEAMPRSRFHSGKGLCSP